MSQYSCWRARLARLLPWRPFLPKDQGNPVASQTTLKVIIVVEGPHDIAFLRRISAMLHAHEPELPDLGAMEHRKEVIFLPFGGVDLKLWTHRLAPVEKPELHIYDRETSPETELRRQLADSVNRRPGCLAFVTKKRSLENYVHSAAIREASGLDITFGDDDDVADLIARQSHAGEYPDEVWEELSRRKQTRRRNRIKRWLNRSAVERMTPQRLAERDPQGDVRSWLQAMCRLIDGDH